MSTTLRKHEMFIGGEWTPGAGKDAQEIVNPATGKVIAHVPKGIEQDVDGAVAAARKAFDEGWSETTPRDRSERLLKLAQAIEADGEELAQIESENVGKPLAPTISEEIPPIADCFRFFAGAARLLEGRAAGEYMKGFTSILRREPLGVVGSIAPWNYPLMMAAWKLGPALAAGNTVVLKPSEWTPLTALKLAELAADILPPGVLNVITGDGEPVGAGIVRHPGVGMVSLTGDVATGKEIARNAASTLKRVHLELGGKAPVVVFDDADLEKVVEWIKIGGYFNAGQDCTAATRVIAGPHIHEKLLGDLVPVVSHIKVGDPLADDTEMGPLVSEEQLTRVSGFVGRALRMARKLQFGTVWINTHIPLVNEMPHGGYKQSGYGKDMSVYSLEEYTQIKHVMASLD